MKKLAIVLSFVFAAALITPTFAEENKKTVKAGTTAEKGCTKEAAKTCSSKEAKACCSKDAKATDTKK